MFNGTKFVFGILLTFLVSFSYSQSKELLSNPNFTDGTNSWWTSGANVTSGNGEIKFKITNPGTNTWDIQLGQGGLSLRKGFKYTLSWRAKRESASLNFQVQLDHGSYTKLFGTQTVHFNNWSESLIVFENIDSDIPGVSVNVLMGGSNAEATFDYISLIEEPLVSNDIIITNPGTGPVSYYGQMQAVGNKIYGSKTQAPMQVKGLSFFWSLWGGEEYWNTEAVNSIVNDWKAEIIRVPMGVEFNDDETGYKGYLDPKGRDRQIRLVETLVNAAIARDIYVLIDYHSHNAETHTQNAKEFFGYMAKKYGKYDNVIFEIYNEPIEPNWQIIKDYSKAVIDTIRQYSDNLVVLGNEFYSLRPDVASINPVDDQNVAYVFHIYAGYGNENEELLARVNTALNNNKALFVTEWGTIYPWGEKNARTDNASFASSDFWMNILDQDMISSANWCVLSTNMKDANPNEACLFNEEFGSISRNGVGWTDTTLMTPSGKYVYKLLQEQAQKVQWRKEIKVTESPIVLSPGNSLSNISTSPTFMWQKTKNSVTYYFQLADNLSFDNIVKSDTTISDTTVIVSGLLEGQKYYWRVLAKNTNGSGPWSSISNFITILSAPTNLTLQKGETNEVNLSWKDNSSNEEGYLIERKQSPQTSFSLLDTVKGSGNKYVDKNIEQGNTYIYRIKAYTRYCESNLSNEASLNVTDVSEIKLPKEFALNQNYPNPFNPATLILYQLPENSFVTIKLYDILGRQVAELVNEMKQAGYHELKFNAAKLAGGLYIYRIQAGKFSAAKKLMLLK